MLQLTKVLKEGRRELVLCGEEVAKDFEENGLDTALFSAKQLNYLSINRTRLEILPPGIGKLCNLVNLALHTNCLKELPSEISELHSLKYLDVSKNSLVQLPAEISNLKEIVILNVSFNELRKIPSVQSNKKLQVLDLSYNKFEIFPDICYTELKFLTELKLDGNKIKHVPALIRVLSSLKSLSITGNQLCTLPSEIANLKLKDIKLNDNHFSDKNLKKIVSGGNTKKILEYIRKHCTPYAPVEEIRGVSTVYEEDEGDPTPREDDNPKYIKNVRSELAAAATITRMEGLVGPRKFILCCVIKNVKFNAESLQNFLRIQNVIHTRHCGGRNLAAIGTHDFDVLSHKSIIYTCKDPSDIFLMPLGSDRKISAAEFIKEQKLKARKMNKRTQNSSGTLKYIHLLEGLQTFPCLMTEDGADVISLPPITNSEISKIHLNTKNIFIEITSQHSQLHCKAIMESLLLESLTLGIGDHELCDEDRNSGGHLLQLASVEINNSDGSLYEHYPSRTDLTIFPNDVKRSFVC